MLSFDNANSAVNAAIAMQQQFHSEPVYKRVFVKVRIGFHLGPIDYDKGHPFGDTVNVAARVVALAEAERIIATQSSLKSIRDSGDFIFRPYQKTRVKGKNKPLLVEEIVWDSEDSTLLFSATQLTLTSTISIYLKLDYMGKTFTVNSENPIFTFGRSEQNRIVIDSEMASRSHAKIELRWGEFFLVDHSTNGTYVITGEGQRESDGAATRLHRREAALQGKGVISIGRSSKHSAPECLMRYEIVS